MNQVLSTRYLRSGCVLAPGFRYRPLTGISLHFLLFLIGTLISGNLGAREPKPNFIFIVADDMGYADCGVHGCKDVPTPHLDSLASTGVRFTDGYVTGTVCSPSRAALMTARYHYRDGVKDWIPPGKPGIDPQVPTIAEYIRAQGYRTGLVGKWHLGEDEACHPLNRGFDEFFGFLGGGRSYFPDKAPVRDNRVNHYTQLVRNREPAEESEYITSAFAREACAFIDRNKDRPFFLYLAFNAVHTPMQAPAESVTRFAEIGDAKRRTYAAMLSAMDDAIGRVMSGLRGADLESKTFICFISDNGGPITRNAPNASRNTPLRGGKGETWEGGIRVPFFIKWKGHFGEGTVVRRPVIQMDITATALELAGARPNEKWPLDGRSLLGVLNGEEKEIHEKLCWSYEKQWAIRRSRWKLTFASPRPGVGPEAQLFDLEEDPAELKDLSKENPERVKELQRDWEQWRLEVAGPNPAG